MTDCIFCGIVAGTLPAQIVHETDTTVAFLDTRPLFHGHVLVVPREHYVTLPDLPADQVPGFFAEVRRIAGVMPMALDAQGTFLAMNNVVSQSVPHLHCHIVPRTKGDGLRGFFWPRRRYKDDQASQVAERLRKALN
ncbi:HIT family protein [Calidifontibacter sp. DB0510]|uniref:HIT family protein n=1 Tax=Metallococcus carri TaxID=1656884 RepID=A0A967EH79_9MICO|nr:HIT family protein [Metallococcus carri]NHN56013.1 HIT family protein [Metallococcus carri]NOP37530.1 HIT family protein [Calidifontibacter sp. DB2511S]